MTALAADYPCVIFSGEHPGSTGEVTIICESWRPSLSSSVFPRPSQRLLIDSFGVSRGPAIAARFGAFCQVLGVYDPSGPCLFTMLFSAEPHVRAIWARELKQVGCDPRPAFASKRVVMDFVAVARQIRGRVMHYVVLALHYLRFCGYSGIASECQEVHQLALWLRKGVRLLNPPPFDLGERLLQLADQRKRTTGRSPDSVEGLRDGERLFARDDKWQLFLGEPVFFTYDLDGEPFARLTRSVLGTTETGMRVAKLESETGWLHGC